MKKPVTENMVSLILRIAAMILILLPVIYTAGHIAGIPEYKKTLSFIFLTVLVEILTIVLDRKTWCEFFHVVGTVFIALAFTSFVSGGVLSIADYIAGINLFGDASQVPAIITYSIILFVGLLLSLVDCFIYNNEKNK